MVNAKYEMKVGDDIKFAYENSMLVRYGTIVKINKVTFRIKNEDGSMDTVPKSLVWLD